MLWLVQEGGFECLWEKAKVYLPSRSGLLAAATISLVSSLGASGVKEKKKKKKCYHLWGRYSKVVSRIGCTLYGILICLNGIQGKDEYLNADPLAFSGEH